MERRQIYSLAVLVVCAAIGVIVGTLLTSAMRGRLGRPDAVSPSPPHQEGRGLTPQEMLGRLQK